MATTQVPVETTAKGAARPDQVRQQRGVGIVDAGRRPACRRPGRWRAATSGSIGPSAIARPAQRRDPVPPAQAASTSGEKSPLARVPQVGVAAERGHVGGRSPGQPEAPVLRIGQDVRRPGAHSGDCARHASRAARRGSGPSGRRGEPVSAKGGRMRVVGGAQSVRARRARSRGSAAARPPPASTSAAAGAVGGDRDRVDAMARRSKRARALSSRNAQ